MNNLRYGVREEEHPRRYPSFYVIDYSTGLAVSGRRLSHESAQADADRMNGEALRLEVEQRRSA